MLPLSPPHQLLACSIQGGELGHCCELHPEVPSCSEFPEGGRPCSSKAWWTPRPAQTLTSGALQTLSRALGKTLRQRPQLYNLVTIRNPHPSVPGPRQCVERVGFGIKAKLKTRSVS